MFRVETSEREVAWFLSEPLPSLQLPGFESSRRFWPRAQPSGRRAGPAAETGDAASGEDAGEESGGEGAGVADEAEDIPDERLEGAFEELLNPLLDAYEAPIGVADPVPRPEAPLPEADRQPPGEDPEGAPPPPAAFMP